MGVISAIFMPESVNLTIEQQRSYGYVRGPNGDLYHTLWKIRHAPEKDAP
jgi:hypothetical protein